MQLLRELAKGVQHASTLSHETIGQAATAAALVDADRQDRPDGEHERADEGGGRGVVRAQEREGVDTNRNWAVDWGSRKPTLTLTRSTPALNRFPSPRRGC